MATPIKSIKPQERYEMIVVRFCRTWLNRDIDTGNIISCDFVLVDEEVKKKHLILFMQKLIYLSLLF